MATYTDLDAASIDLVAVYSDAALTVLVEDVTANVVDIGVGLYEISTALDLSLYSLGVTYYLKVTFTPPSAVQRTQSLKIRVLPVSAPAVTAALTGTDSDGEHVQPPLLRLRMGLGSYRDADMTSAVAAVRRDRYEAEFQPPDEVRGKILHFLVYAFRAGEPWALTGLTVEYTGQGKWRAN